MKKFLAAALLLAELWLVFFRNQPAPEPGVRIMEEPDQEATDASAWTFGDYEVRTLARYRIRARVLARKRYYFDGAADIAPVDLALGWQGMSDSAVLKHFHITQGSRWYEYLYDAACPLSPGEIAIQSANVHCLPADAEVAGELKSLRKNDFVEMTGFLVEVRHPDRPPWTSSLVRDDAGNGACEIFWVEDVWKFTP